MALQERSLGVQKCASCGREAEVTVAFDGLAQSYEGGFISCDRRMCEGYRKWYCNTADAQCYRAHENDQHLRQCRIGQGRKSKHPRCQETEVLGVTTNKGGYREGIVLRSGLCGDHLHMTTAFTPLPKD